MIRIDLLYLFILAGLAAFFALKYYLVRILKFVLHPSGPIHDLALAHIFLPLLIRKRRLWGPMTRFQALIYLGYFAGTIVYNTVGTHDFATARSRAGFLAILHVACLALFPQLSIGAAFFNVSLRTYHRLHTLLGVIGVSQSLLHIFLALQTTSFNLDISTQCYGLSAIIGIAVVFLTILPLFRHRLHELCMKLHLMLGILTPGVLLLHLKDKLNLNGFLLIGSMAIFSITTTGHILYQILRNKTKEQSLAIVQRTKLEGAIKLTFCPTRPWKIHAGQYIYLRVPAVSHFSFAETHPFHILWWEENPLDGKADTITILAQVKTGFTRRLYSCPQTSLRVIVDGPYGRSRDTDCYDSFVFISTGIGITAQLSYVKELINRGQRSFRIRRLYLIWQAEQDAHDDWICEYVNELREMDLTEMVLRWALFIDPASQNEPGRVNDEKPLGDIGRRGLRHFGKPNLQSILDDEVGNCPTKILLTVSGDTEMRETCRNIAIQHRQKISLFETDFQPQDVSSGFWAPKVATENVIAPRKHLV